MKGKITITLKDNINLVRITEMLEEIDDLINTKYLDIVELNIEGNE